MTYREWMKSSTARFNIGESDIELMLTNQAALIPDTDATVDVRTAKLALCGEIATIIPMANISEGGYSLSWNMDAVKLWYTSMCRELGIADVTKPKVKGRSDLW